MNNFAQAITAIAMGTLVGFLGVGALARGIDTLESRKCPEVTRIRVNGGTILKDWAAWGACPRAGLVSPLQP
jgi:hypothetical protein